MYILFLYICLVALGSAGSGPAAELCAKAQHHSTSVQMIDRHLVRQEGADPTERCICF